MIVAPDLRRAVDAAGDACGFDALPPSDRDEYVRRVEEAKRPQTRRRRIEPAVERTMRVSAGVEPRARRS